MDTKVFETYESEVRSYCRAFPTVLCKAKGACLYDEEGKEYIDFFCGAGAVNYGHNNDYIKEKLIRYLMEDGVMHSLDMYTVPKRELLEFLENQILKPRGLDYKIQFPGPTGTNAVEAALKLARKVKKRTDIWALMGAFHGMTMGALALTTDRKARHGAGVALENVVHIPAPYMFPEWDTIRYMQTLLDDDHSGVEKPAALVIETVQAEGGIWVMETEWLQAVEKFCRDNDILLIVDDIQVGCARTGNFFSFERAGIHPDMFVMSKSIGGYGLPFALTFLKPELDQWLPAEHNGTFRGNQLAIVAAKAGLEYMLDHEVEKQAREKGAVMERYFAEQIQPLDSRIGMRGLGMIQGIDFSGIPDEDFCSRVRRHCFEHQLIIESAGRKDCVLKLMPPLTIEKDLLLQGMDILKQSIQEALDEMK